MSSPHFRRVCIVCAVAAIFIFDTHFLSRLGKAAESIGLNWRVQQTSNLLVATIIKSAIYMEIKPCYFLSRSIQLNLKEPREKTMNHFCFSCLKRYSPSGMNFCMTCGASYCDSSELCAGECLCDLEKRIAGMTTEERMLRLKALSDRKAA